MQAPPLQRSNSLRRLEAILQSLDDDIASLHQGVNNMQHVDSDSVLSTMDTNLGTLMLSQPVMRGNMLKLHDPNDGSIPHWKHRFLLLGHNGLLFVFRNHNLSSVPLMTLRVQSHYGFLSEAYQSWILQLDGECVSDGQTTRVRWILKSLDASSFETWLKALCAVGSQGIREPAPAGFTSAASQRISVGDTPSTLSSSAASVHSSASFVSVPSMERGFSHHEMMMGPGPGQGMPHMGGRAQTMRASANTAVISDATYRPKSGGFMKHPLQEVSNAGEVPALGPVDLKRSASANSKRGWFSWRKS
ncbi:hypothetical protein BC830DRAFT_1111038 [Chytriomyces sp. MP71]|nr:hypothetical protein BC830DRAFT_1111038 [Chytriomyces sp. MP71]